MCTHIVSQASIAMLYAFYIYSRNGSCLYHKIWNGGKSTSSNEQEEMERLLFGLLFSLKEFVNKIAPSSGHEECGIGSFGKCESLHRYQTDTYICHQYETSSGFRFILLSDTHSGDLSSVLRHIYTNIFVAYVMNNPVYDPHRIKTIDNQLFQAHLLQYLEGLPCY